ncbi:hypothetical protein PV749_20480 [Streptomyces sp. ID03-2B]|uniref:Uncharacterized protein n=1 Tax=Streptomyces caviscabies TaxID=90079 RepID=A0ABW2MFB0_9ACTN|nr:MULTISPECIES: hypothetical protein [unclassified Streptomyces]MDX3339606.1 hypothetical protein [Streptomyces sp. ME02-6979.5a]MDX3503362.1 hypothetical protein [Streptomyces sp. ATCC51928]MDX3593500.1 hypothetical protein [Streptomyces sp. ID03-2B]MDX5523721.1 hypothetical protein [Streptomyces sp. DE06-01C]
MNRQLPRAYWCHADTDRTPAAGPPDDLVTTLPGPAVIWMRDSVRRLTPGLDRDARYRARAWLDDRRAAETAVRSLRRGQGYAYVLPTPDGTWRWTAYPVSALPLSPSGHPPLRSHR